jgi:hypothetical protein
MGSHGKHPVICDPATLRGFRWLKRENSTFYSLRDISVMTARGFVPRPMDGWWNHVETKETLIRFSRRSWLSLLAVGVNLTVLHILFRRLHLIVMYVLCNRHRRPYEARNLRGWHLIRRSTHLAAGRSAAATRWLANMYCGVETIIGMLLEGHIMQYSHGDVRPSVCPSAIANPRVRLFPFKPKLC